MPTITIAARRLVTPTAIVEYPLIEVKDGYIASIRPGDGSGDDGPQDGYRFPDGLIVPALIDIHIHGAAGHDVMEGTESSLAAVGGFLAARGVGGYFPTTVTAPVDRTLQSLSLLAREIARPSHAGAVPLGIHLEGPFLSVAKRGVHTAALLQPPSIALFERFWQAAEGHIRLMTIAPELPDALDLIRFATGLGVRCSLGHSDASYSQAEAGSQAGAKSATHTFNGMRRLDHRDPGIAGFVLDDDDLFAEIVCDGVHVDPAMVRIFAKAKGKDRAILITDGMSATGMPDGKYFLGEIEVDVANGRCMSGGTIAGSVLTLDRAVRNFAAFTGCDTVSAVRLATVNPAKLVGIEESWGSLAEGREANLAVLSPDGEVFQSFRAGRPLVGD